MRSITDILRSQIGFIKYAILNYLDKALTFAIPLIVLYVFKDKGLYNEIEYIYSIAAVAAVAIELGVSNYFLYAYRQADNRNLLVRNVRGWFLLQLAIYQLLGITLLSVAALCGLDVTFTYIYILVRTLYMFFLSFFIVYFRLIDRPSKIFIYSLSANLITILLLAVARFVLHQIDLAYLFLSQMALLLTAFIYYMSQRSQISFSGLVSYVKQSLTFAWPILLNVFLFMFISNYGKIYARNFLSQDDMFHISFVQRVSITIWVAHASAVGYLSKRIFIDRQAGVSRSVLGLYSVMVAGCVGLVFLAFFLLKRLHSAISVDIDAVTILIIAHTVAWCYVSFFEMYVNRINKNKYILLFSLIASAVFGCILLLNMGEPLYTISVGMMGSMVCNLAMVLWFLHTRYGRICV